SWAHRPMRSGSTKGWASPPSGRNTWMPASPTGTWCCRCSAARAEGAYPENRRFAPASGRARACGMTPLPSKDQIRQWIAENPGLTSKRDIAKAFGLKGDQRAELRRLLREMEEEGGVVKSARRFRPKGELPPVALLRVMKPDAAGDLFAEAMEEGVDKEAGRILIVPKTGDPALAEGDRILARLTRVDLDDYTWEARLIRRIGSNPLKVLGVFRKGSE